MICKSCSNILPNGAKFCGKCGTKTIIERKCSECGTLLAQDDIFCMECGVKYADDASSQQAEAKAGQTTQAFSESRIARRSDLLMLGKNCRQFDLPLVSYGKRCNDFAFYDGHLYRADKDEVHTTIIKIHQKTLRTEYIAEFDEDYGNICGVNSTGIFLARFGDRDKKTGIYYMNITCVGFDGTLLGKIKTEAEGTNEEGYDINYIKWSIIIDNNLYITDGSGVKMIDIKSGGVDTIYKVEDKREEKILQIGKVTADADYVYFNMIANGRPEIEYNGNTYRLWTNNYEYWYCYNIRTRKIQCISSSKRDLRNLFESPADLCDEIYDLDEGCWVDNPRFIKDPDFFDIKAVNVVKGIMWVLDNDEMLIAREIKSKSLCPNLKWRYNINSYASLIYFNGELMLEVPNYHTIIAYDKNGNQQGIVGMGDKYFYDNCGHGGCENIVVEGEYVYGDFDAHDKLLRFNINKMNIIEPAPEADIK